MLGQKSFFFLSVTVWDVNMKQISQNQKTRTKISDLWMFELIGEQVTLPKAEGPKPLNRFPLVMALPSNTWGQNISEMKISKWAVNQQPRPSSCLKLRSKTDLNHIIALWQRLSFLMNLLCPFAQRPQDQRILSSSKCIRFTQKENPLLEAIRSGSSLTLSKD